MPDDQNDGLNVGSDSANEPVMDKSDAKSSPFLANLTQIVAIVATLIGFGFTAWQLHLKAVSDNDTSRNNALAEQYKLELGREQIRSQQQTQESLSNLHRDDSSAQHLKDKDDRAFQEKTTRDAEVRSNHEHLATLVDRLFSSNGGAEGEFSSLFSFVHSDPESTQIVTNALLARLYTPKSKGEIDLGLRLFQELGIDSIQLIANVNRNARTVLDGYIVRRVETLIFAINGNRDSLRTINGHQDIERDILKKIGTEIRFGPDYLCATANQQVMSWEILSYSAPVEELGEAKHEIPLLLYEIEQTDDSLSKVIERYYRPGASIDLSGTYLSGAVLDILGKKLNIIRPKLIDAYVERGTFGSSLERAIDSHSPLLFDATTIDVSPIERGREGTQTRLPAFCSYEFVRFH